MKERGRSVLGDMVQGVARGRRLQHRLDVEAVAEEDRLKSHPKGSCWDLIS